MNGSVDGRPGDAEQLGDLARSEGTGAVQLHEVLLLLEARRHFTPAGLAAPKMVSR